ncbi:bactofilin family protein [Maribellus mangrovi]|uniref:bactofilin family protein n=1 Tax=Maribellus mangrovi TaxID=3133146 RepID=UPI0030EED7E7
MAKQTARFNGDDASQHINILGNGTKVKGDIISNGDIRIDGEMVGNLATKGKLVVGNSGKIQGEVQASSIEVSGFINGKVTAAELLNMKATAKIEGDIVAGKLAVEPGAVFTGTCSMGAPKPVHETETKK